MNIHQDGVNKLQEIGGGDTPFEMVYTLGDAMSLLYNAIERVSEVGKEAALAEVGALSKDIEVYQTEQYQLTGKCNFVGERDTTA